MMPLSHSGCRRFKSCLPHHSHIHKLVQCYIMPQLVKGGKYVFGWSKVYENGDIILPPEACIEYEYNLQDKVILLSGSKTSGGFSLIKTEKLRESSLSHILVEFPELSRNDFPKGKIVRHRSKLLCWTQIGQGCKISLPKRTLDELKIYCDGKLLAARGSGLGLSFITKGPIYQEAQKHSNLEIY